jgi:hypothetical protein
MSAELAHATFLENLGSKFRLKVEGADSFELELAEISELKQTQRNETFAIVFRGQSAPVLQQRIYRLEQEMMGEFDIFLVPIKKDAEGVYYEAVFNRFREDS